MKFFISIILFLTFLQTKAQQLNLSEMEAVLKTESIDSLNTFLNLKKYFLVGRNYNEFNEGTANWAYQSNQNVDLNFKISPIVSKYSKFYRSKKGGSFSSVIEYFIDSATFESIYDQLKLTSLDKVKIDINKYTNSITYRFTVQDNYFANLSRIKQLKRILGGEKVMIEYFTLNMSTYTTKKLTPFYLR
jgi:hypothetical protein